MRPPDEIDESRGCTICNAGMPVDRRLTCSPECLRLYRAQLVELRGRTPFRQLPDRAAKELKNHYSRRGKIRQKCDYCGKEFLAPRAKTYWCSPVCQVQLTGSCHIPETEGPSKPTLADSEFGRKFEKDFTIDGLKRI